MTRDLSYIRPKDVPEAVRALQELGGRGRLIAGGTNLIPDLRAGAANPEAIIDLGGLEELSHIREENGHVSIGALTTMAELTASDIIRRESPVLGSAASQVGNPLTRNRATLGGNLADASPAADTAPPLLTMEASVHTERGDGGGRVIPLDEFFQGPNLTALETDEIITRVTFPKVRDPARGSYIKLGLRSSMAISVVSVAVMLEMKDGVCQRARLALGAVAPKPIRAAGVEGLLQGKRIDPRLVDECAQAVQDEVSPISDIRASSAYRTFAASVLRPHRPTAARRRPCPEPVRPHRRNRHGPACRRC